MKENVEATELALAFPLEQAEPGERSGGLPSLLDKQPVFAFLPLRSYGFRFIIQGDFEVSSSREDVDRDSAWNQWLRSEIPGLFLLALHTFTVSRRRCGLATGAATCPRLTPGQCSGGSRN
ncbi:uncharacterized protein LOC142930155 isoform X2 [Petromyzon marinus]